MNSRCQDVMKTARELIDHGVLAEGAEKLAELHGCGRKAGCDHWHRCIGLVEHQWQASAATSKLQQLASR